MKILVTGAGGQLGRELQVQVGNAPWVTEATFCHRIDLDITEPDAVVSTITHFRPDTIINCAAYTAVDRAESEPDRAYAINALGVENLALACKKIGSRLIHISTDYVFTGDHTQPYLPGDKTAPINTYGKSKLEGEIRMKQALPSATTVRTSWVFGNHGNNFVTTMLKLSETKERIGVVSDQWGAPTYTADLARFILKLLALQNTWGHTLHFSNSGFTNWCDFTREIFLQATRVGLINKTPEVAAITTAEYPTAAPRPGSSILCLKETTAVLGKPPRHWKQALAAMLSERRLLSP